MRRKSFQTMSCPIARSLERVGEWWSMLILRDAFRGATRFEQFQKGLDIAPNILSRRLNALVESGLLERRRYSDHPPRNEYQLTARGRDFRPVLLALLAWGNRHFPTGGPHTVIINEETGQQVTDPILVDPQTLRPVTEPPFRTVYGTAGSAGFGTSAAATVHGTAPGTALGTAPGTALGTAVRRPSPADASQAALPTPAARFAGDAHV